MTIPVSSVVSVNVTLSPAAPSRANFSTLMGITNEATGPLNALTRVKAYTSIDEVAADWPADSELLAIATTYYSQSPKPTDFKAGLRVESALPGLLAGGGNYTPQGSIGEWQAITDGSFNIGFDGGDTDDITGLNFTTASNMEDVAAVIQAGIQASALGGPFATATCTFTGTEFVIASGTTGNGSSVVPFLSDASTGTSIVVMLDMTQGRTRSADGVDPETITATLNVLQDEDPVWYGFMFTKEVRDNVVIQSEEAVKAAGAWAEARVKIFGNISNDAGALNSAIDTDIISALTALGYQRTFSQYANVLNDAQYSVASVFGKISTIDFAQLDGTITLKFKQLPGILTESMTNSQYNALKAKRGNAYIKVGTSNMFAESFMHANGIFIDDIVNIDWLTNALQTEVFGRLYTEQTKIPNTDKGGAVLESRAIAVFDEARNNAMIAPGETIDGEFLSKGYITSVQPVADIPSGDKAARVGPTIFAVALLAGAIHSIQINVALER